jgi:hypothetical protein
VGDSVVVEDALEVVVGVTDTAENRAWTKFWRVYKNVERGGSKLGGKKGRGKTMLTGVAIRFVGVPIVLILDSVGSGATEGNLATYCEIENCPMRKTRPRRDRVWVPAGRLQRQNAIDCLMSQRTHDPGGRVFVQLAIHLDQLTTDI